MTYHDNYDDRTIIFKIKFRCKIKRIEVPAGECMEYDMNMFRDKILDLLHLDKDSEVLISYEDSYGDIVAIEDDDELRTVVSNTGRYNDTIKIFVQLKSDIDGVLSGTLPYLLPSEVNNHNSYQLAEIIKEALQSVTSIIQASSNTVALSSLVDLLSKLDIPNGSLRCRMPDSSGEKPSGMMSLGATAESDKSEAIPSALGAGSSSPMPYNLQKQQHESSQFVGIAKTHSADLDVGKAISYPYVDDFLASSFTSIKSMSQSEEAYAAPNRCNAKSVLNPRHGVVPDMNYPFSDFRRFHGHHESLHHKFYSGVQCANCGMDPIVGPRFKSKVDNYVICRVCYTEMCEDLYIGGINGAYSLSHHRMLNDLNNSYGIGVKPARSKLDSCFIDDVTISDGTVIPPSTPFTKIWRMINNGYTRWPYGTQLVWVGGDHFANKLSVRLEIGSDGLLEEEEIDIALDLTSPSMPGRYISYWSLASPFGNKFGERVWVSIEVGPGNNSPSTLTSDQNGTDSVAVLPIQVPVTDLPQEPVETINFDGIPILTGGPETASHDLCDFAEWDPLNSELQDLGFTDATNKKDPYPWIDNGGDRREWY